MASKPREWVAVSTPKGYGVDHPDHCDFPLASRLWTEAQARLIAAMLNTYAPTLTYAPPDTPTADAHGPEMPAVQVDDAKLANLRFGSVLDQLEKIRTTLVAMVPEPPVPGARRVWLTREEHYAVQLMQELAAGGLLRGKPVEVAVSRDVREAMRRVGWGA